MGHRTLGGLAAAAIGIAGVASEQGAASTWDFQADAVNEPPSGFSFGRTGSGRPGSWVVMLDGSAPAGDRVLAQIDTGGPDHRFALAVAASPSMKDLRLEVRCKPVSGRIDQACGLVFRYRDEDNYYVARANALEDNVRLYRVVEGRRRQIGGWDGKVAGRVWHRLAVEARGDQLQVFWEGKRIIDVADGTFREAGKVGVWTKADSVTYYDALSATPLR